MFLLFILFVTACQTTPQNANLQSAARINAELAIHYLQAGDIIRAKAKLLQAEQQAPKLAFVYEAKAYFWEISGEIDKAEAAYQYAIRLAPDSGSPKHSYAQFLCRQQRYQSAQQQFLIVLQDENYLDIAEVYENAGLCALQQYDYQQAHDFFIKAVQHDATRKYLFALYNSER